MEQTCTFEVDVDGASVMRFAELSGDHNPLHVDATYAAKTEFGQPIAHGALLLGFVSRVLGMHVPGRRCVILSLKARFPRPVPYPTRLRVDGRLGDYDASRGSGTVRVHITSLHNMTVVAEAEVAFTLHTARGVDDVSEVRLPAAQSPSALAVPAPVLVSDRPRLLVTGGTGGLGAAVVEALSPTYELVCLTRRARPGGRSVRFIEADLEDDASLDDALESVDPAAFHGILHMSVSPVRQGRISDDVADVRRQLRHAVEVPLVLARWASRSGSHIRRVVLIGSTWGNKLPSPRTGAYSLAKASMDVLGPLLSHDLAAQNATVNVVRPGFLPVGLNKGVMARAIKSQAARVPSGTLPEGADVAKLIAFLLSEDAGHVNGATLTIDGGMLPQ